VRRRGRVREPVPWPAWVAEYVPADWADDEADAKWLGSLDPECEHAAFLREWHRHGRWQHARDEWIGENDPAWAEAEFRRIIANLGAPE
jgi:hypothetical protein